jgi:hypothetical protein
MLLLHMDSDVPPIAGKAGCGRGHHYSRIAREWPREQGECGSEARHPGWRMIALRRITDRSTSGPDFRACQVRLTDLSQLPVTGLLRATLKRSPDMACVQARILTGGDGTGRYGADSSIRPS